MDNSNQHEPLIRMDSVRMCFGNNVALDNLSFIVHPGEIFGFLGPSGAGKTTTIKLLTKQLHATAGTIHVFGKELSALPQTMYDQVGVLTDTSGLYERLSVYDNLVVFADLKKLPHSVIHDCLAQVGLADEVKKPAKALSRGMKQRLMLVRAVMHKPRLLFLDEPTAALDPGTAQQIHALLRKLNQEGTTIFLTTHNMEEADKLCGRVAFLNKGSIVACDTPDSLKLSHARNELIARTTSGHVYTVEKSTEGLHALLQKLASDSLLTLHSQEPNLEEIFLKLTGRELS